MSAKIKPSSHLKNVYNRTSFTKTRQNKTIIKAPRSKEKVVKITTLKIGLTNNKQKQNITFISYRLRLEEPTRIIAKRGRHNLKRINKKLAKFTASFKK